MKNKIFSSMFLVLMAVLLMGVDDSCSTNDRAAKEQETQTEKMALESNRQVGMPGITIFTEKRLLRQLYELRDQEISTFTYIVDFQGRLFHVCDSIGFGMPFSAQFTTPEKYIYNGATLPQPEPNGLFPPTSSSATWIICADPNGEFRPLYVEPQIIVSVFPLSGAVDSYSEGYQPEKEQ